MPINPVMQHTSQTITILFAFLIFCFALSAADPQPVGKESRDPILKSILKAQATRLNYFQTRDQATDAMQKAEKEAQAAQESLNSVLAEARKADKVGPDCNPTIELTWSCPAKPEPTAAKK